jgi:hypothetical protein
VVNDSQKSLDTEDVVRDDEALEHVDLSSLDFEITVLFVPQSKHVAEQKLVKLTCFHQTSYRPWS